MTEEKDDAIAKTDSDKSQIKREEVISEVRRLASLDKIEYELIRESVAKKFEYRVSKLDELVDEERRKSGDEKSASNLFPKVEPWGEPVNLTTLLDEIVDTFNKYISFKSSNEPSAIVLWCIHTYCIEAAFICPILFVKSPEMQCGKSTLLGVLQRMVFKCLPSSGITPAAIFRVIEEHHPTLICDEADTYMSENEGLRGVFNAGHSRDTSKFMRVNPDTREVETFDTFGAKCIAAIKSLPGTIEDRAITIEMQRIPRSEKKDKLRLINPELKKYFYDIQRKCIRFASDNIEHLKKINPTLPDSLNSRAADNWHPLFQIASIAGDEWIKRATDAALALSGVEVARENKSLGIELLEDIQNIFDVKYKDSADVTSADLIEALCQDEEAPWLTFNSKRTNACITQRQLAFHLKPYGITPKTLTRAEKRPKGYLKSAFEDAFARYIYSQSPEFPNTSATTAPARRSAGLKGKDENNLSATERIDPLPAVDPKSPGEPVADRTATERIDLDSENTLEAAPPKVGVVVADKIANLEGESVSQDDHIDL